MKTSSILYAFGFVILGLFSVVNANNLSLKTNQFKSKIAAKSDVNLTDAEDYLKSAIANSEAKKYKEAAADVAECRRLAEKNTAVHYQCGLVGAFANIYEGNVQTAFEQAVDSYKEELRLKKLPEKMFAEGNAAKTLSAITRIYLKDQISVQTAAEAETAAELAEKSFMLQINEPEGVNAALNKTISNADKALALDKFNMTALAYKGLALDELGKFREAHEHWEKASNIYRIPFFLDRRLRAFEIKSLDSADASFCLEKGKDLDYYFRHRDMSEDGAAGWANRKDFRSSWISLKQMSDCTEAIIRVANSTEMKEAGKRELARTYARMGSIEVVIGSDPRAFLTGIPYLLKAIQTNKNTLATDEINIDQYVKTTLSNIFSEAAKLMAKAELDKNRQEPLETSITAEAIIAMTKTIKE